jgi:hypothetical protein
LQNSPLECSCVVVALIENYSTSKPIKFSPEKSQILGCGTVIANEQYIPYPRVKKYVYLYGKPINAVMKYAVFKRSLL